ncbi:ABC transporter permease [Propylenella binzhouense]|uniref:ABC transporter permease n=1 Tax=Propylenella binzhouense TaxID=2555902 RepID=A0A964T3U3_9HYPH|nr:ABC transporter permease [Propylenella binzhouense]MYZ47037.1 ABC transporter permease [Propylenella binzhouense]
MADGSSGEMIAGGSAWLTSSRRMLVHYAVTGSNILALAILLAVGASLSPYFLDVTNIFNVMRGTSMVGIVAIGMTYVILNRGIDLSVGSIVGVAAILSAGLAEYGVLGWVIAPVLFAGLLGLGNGLLITQLKLQPFIATLGMMIFARGLVYVYSDGSPIVVSDAPSAMRFLGSGYLGPVPMPVIVFALVALIGAVVLKSTIFGREVYAVGANEEAARLSGIHVQRNQISVYVISGLCAGLAGILLTARLTVGDPNAGTLFELDAIAATLIGGTTFDGGVGSVGGTVIGIMILAFLANILNLVGVSPYMQMLLKGVIIVLAVVVSELRKRRV